jgi:beta-glucosidase
VSNIGKRRGSTVVQVYARRPDSGITRADRELKAFTKLSLDLGGSTRVSMTLSAAAFRHWDLEAGAWTIEGGAAEILVGESSRDIRLSTHVDVDDIVLP